MNTHKISYSMALSILLAGAALLPPTTAFAQDIEQRVDNLEHKIDALLELMQQQAAGGLAPQPPASATTPAAETPVAVPESIRMGQLYLDVHTLSMSKADLDRASYDASAIPAEPNGIAVGSVVIEPSGRFEYGAFVSDPALAPFAQANALVQTVWNGVLQIDHTGPHAFQLSVGKEEGSSGGRTCRASFNIGGKSIVSTLISNTDSGRRVYSTEQGSISLQPGFYDFTVYVACIRWDGDVFERYGATLLMAAPGDRVAKPIPANRFGIRE